MLRRTRKRLGKLRNLRLIEPKGVELSKILISTKNTDITGRELSRELLERFHLQMEMASIDYVTALTSVGDSEEGMERLCNALEILDRERNWRSKQDQEIMLPRLQRVATISEMDEREKVSVSWEQCQGKVAAEMVYVYPPGIPLIVPGERISRDVIECVNSYRNCGFAIEGTKEDKKIQIERE